MSDENCKKTNVVLDKSYLQGCSKKVILENCKSYKFLLSNALTFEIAKDNNNRSALFKKIPTPPRFSEYIPSVEYLLQWEIKESKECGKPSDSIKKRDYSIIRIARNKNYRLNNEQIHSLAKEKDFISTLLHEGMLPIIKSIFESNTKNQISDELNKLKNGKINDFVYINNFIEEQRCNGAKVPKIRNFSTNSATYRWFQVVAIFSHDICNRYENFTTLVSSEKALEKMRHDINDMSYLILGLLEGGFAVKEKKLISLWELLKIHGVSENQLLN